MDSSYVVVDKPSSSDWLSYFRATEGATSWTHEECKRIRDTRALAPQQTLFVDRLLALVGLEGPSVYPPENDNELASLLLTLSAVSESPELLRQCVVLYLLFAARKPAYRFADDTLMPVSFVRGVRSFYALDSQDFTGALPSLADPRNPAAREYASSILELLSRAPGATPSQRSELVLSFVRSCVRVPLPPAVEMSDEDEEDAMDDGEGSSYLIRFLGTLGPDAPFLLVDALCDPSRERGAAQAWSFARALEGQVEMQGKQVAMREELQKRVLARCLGDNASRAPVASHLRTLLALPFDEADDAVVDTFLLAPPNTLQHIALAHDWRIAKLVAESRTVDAVRFAALTRQRGFQSGSEDRIKLLQSLRSVVPEVTRVQIDLEHDALIPPPPPHQQESQVDIAHPAWEPAPAPRAPSPPRSIAEVARDSPQKGDGTPTAPPRGATPLSASPFVRQGTSRYVSSFDGTPLGGSQKSILKALAAARAQSPRPSPSGAATPASDATPVRGASPARRTVPRGGTPLSERARSPAVWPSTSQQSASPYTVDGASPFAKRAPTVAGLGSVRPPQYNHAPPALPAPLSMDLDDDAPPPLADDEEQGDDEGADFTRRLLQNAPGVTTTLARAAAAEAAARQRSQRSGARKQPPTPGAFPSHADDHDDDDEDEEHEEEPVPARRTRRTARSSSRRSATEEPELEPPSRRTSKRTSAATAEKTPARSKRTSTTTGKTPATAARRSKRLATPAPATTDEDEAAAAAPPPSSAARQTRRSQRSSRK